MWWDKLFDLGRISNSAPLDMFFSRYTRYKFLNRAKIVDFTALIYIVVTAGNCQVQVDLTEKDDTLGNSEILGISSRNAVYVLFSVGMPRMNLRVLFCVVVYCKLLVKCAFWFLYIAKQNLGPMKIFYQQASAVCNQAFVLLISKHCETKGFTCFAFRYTLSHHCDLIYDMFKFVKCHH